MINIAVIDDEENARFLLRADIEKNFQGKFYQILEADSVYSGKKLLAQNPIDLLFLDIELGDGNAFHLLERIKTIDFKVIFVTAYDEFALKAFQFFAFGYLVKPFKSSDLVVLVNRFLEQKEVTNSSSLRILSESILDKEIKKIILTDMDGFHVIDLADILYVHSDNNYSIFILKNGEKLMSSRTLKEYERSLQDQGFFRCHRQFLVNLEHVHGYSKNDGGYIIMSTKENIPIGRRRVAAFRKIYL